MSETEHELSQDDSAVEITPLPKEGTQYEEKDSSKSTVHDGGRQIRQSAKRYLLITLTLCLVVVFFLIAVVLPGTQSPKRIAQPSSPGILLTLNPTGTPINNPTDYRVYTTIVDSVVYAGAANGGVYALNASNGGVLWHHKIDPGADSAPLVSKGIVYITANRSDVGPGTLYALRASDGMELWHYTSNKPLSDPSVGNDRVFVTSYDDASQIGNMIALRASDGVQLWHKTASGFAYNTPIVDNQAVYVSAIKDNGSSIVFALQASNGTQLWKKATTTFTSVSLVTNGIAYLLANQELSAVSANNGQLLWNAPVEGDSWLLPQPINGVLYLITTQISPDGAGTPTSQGSVLPQLGMIGNLLQGVVERASMKQALLLKQGLSSVYAVRISDGTVLWHYTLNKENGNNWANWLSVEDGTVYVGSFVDQAKSYIYALRSDDGMLLWRQAMYRGMIVNAVVDGGIIYVASFVNDGSTNAGSGASYALRGSDGSQLWLHSMYWVVYDPPVFTGSTIFVSTGSGDVYAYQASSGSLLWHFHTNVQ